MTSPWYRSALLRCCWNGALLAGCAAAGAGTGPSIPTPLNGFRPEDRVVVGNFSHVYAVAAAIDRVYVVFGSAIAIWYPVEERWDVPVTPDFVERLPSVTGAVIDPADRSLWLSTPSTWLRYDPFEYGRVNPSLPPPALRRPVTVSDAMRDLPQLRALAPHIALGPRQEPGQLTAAAPDPRGAGWFLGTSTRGLVFFDRMASDAVPIPFGLAGDVVGAIVPMPDGIWVATDADANHAAGVTRLSPDFAASFPIAGSLSEGLPVNTVRRLVVTDGPVWMATDRGVLVTSKDRSRFQRFDVTAGLPDEHVTALAVYHGQLVAGTLRGLAATPGDSAFRRFALDYTEPVYALRARGDTLWVGTPRGLFATGPDADELRMPEGFHQLSGSTVPILGIGYVSDTLVAMTADRLLWRSPSSGEWNEGPVLSTQLGALVGLDAGDHGAWVAGPRGVAFVRPTTPPLRILVTPGQLPAEVTAVAMRGQFLWVGTRGGLVRYLLDTP